MFGHEQYIIFGVAADAPVFVPQVHIMLRTGPSILYTHRAVPVRLPVYNHIHQRKPAVSYPVCLPPRFHCILQYLGRRRLTQTSRRRKAVPVWAAKGDSGKTDSADSSTSKDQKKQEEQLERADKKADSKTAENRADSKASSKAEAKADGKSESKSDKSRSSKQPKHPEFDVAASASQGLKPVHLATFFIILGTGLMFLAVLLWFTADIRFQQACTKVIRRLFKTVALRQVMGILGAMTFVRLGLEPMVKMLRRLFRAPGSWEKSSEFYILREVCFLCRGPTGSALSGVILL